MIKSYHAYRGKPKCEIRLYRNALDTTGHSVCVYDSKSHMHGLNNSEWEAVEVILDGVPSRDFEILEPWGY